MIYEASLSGVLRIVLWIIVISFILRIIARLALPYVIRKAENNMRQRAADFRNSQYPQREEGDITIESGKSSSGRQADGEYVDYVEIKE